MRSLKKNPEKALQGKEQFKAEVTRWAEALKVKPKKVRVQRMRTKWASCSLKGSVTFSTNLFKEPEPFQQYVIVHELLHLQVPNHGKLFKSLMNAYLPGWETILKERNKKEGKDMCETEVIETEG